MANKHPVLCNGVQSDKLMMVDLTNTKLIETGLKRLGVYFVVKQEQGTKELVEMILLWLISLSVSHWGSSLLTRQGSETQVIRVLRHRVSRSNGSCICHGWLLGRSLMVTGVISSLEVGGVSYRACQKGLGNPWSRQVFMCSV